MMNQKEFDKTIKNAKEVIEKQETIIEKAEDLKEAINQSQKINHGG
jgi:hypothetical protein